jgi:hypothetical protein
MGGLSMLMNGGSTMAHTMCRLSSVMAIFAMIACPTWSAVVSRRWWKFGGAAPKAWWSGSGGEVKVGG